MVIQDTLSLKPVFWFHGFPRSIWKEYVSIFKYSLLRMKTEADKLRGSCTALPGFTYMNTLHW